jgi:hypothetical protein
MLDLDAFPDQPVLKEEREVVNSIYSVSLPIVYV